MSCTNGIYRSKNLGTETLASNADQSGTAKLTFFSDSKKTIPFDFQGNSYQNNPVQKSAFQIRQGRKSTAPQTAPLDSASAPEWAEYFKYENYHIANFLQDNILDGDVGSSLFYNGTSYTFKFGCIHFPLLTTYQTTKQLSLIFEASNKNIFHICIPVENDTSNTNLFLKYWLYRDEFKQTPKPSKFTLNNLFQFKDPELKTTCFYINTASCLLESTTTISYAFCLFVDPICLDPEKCTPSMKEFLTKPTPPSRTFFNITRDYQNFRAEFFEEVFYSKRQVNMIVTTRKDIYRFKTTFMFQPWSVSLADTPVEKFEVSIDALLKKVVQPSGQKKLENIKCYPIDIDRNVDEEGNVIIDEKKKPIDIVNTNADDALFKASGDNSIRNTFVSFIIIVGSIISVVLLVYFGILLFFRYKSSALTSATQTLGAVVNKFPTPATASAVAVLANIKLLLAEINTLLAGKKWKDAEAKLRDIREALAGIPSPP